jgi:hypothetical protein
VRACYVLDDTNAAVDLWIRTVLTFLISALMTPMEWNAGQTHVSIWHSEVAPSKSQEWIEQSCHHYRTVCIERLYNTYV